MMRDNDVENSEEDVGKPRTERDEDDSVPNEKFLFKEPIVLVSIVCLSMLNGLSFYRYTKNLMGMPPALLHMYNSLTSVVSAVGVIFAAFLSEDTGRKLVYRYFFALSIFSSTLLLSSNHPNVISVIILLRTIVFGGSSMMKAVAISEYSSPKHRFMWFMFDTIVYNITSSIMFSLAWDSEMLFYVLTVIQIVLGLICLGSTWVWPESPYWLANKGKLEQSREAFLWLRGEGGRGELAAALQARRHPGPAKLFWISLLVALATISISTVGHLQITLSSVFYLYFSTIKREAHIYIHSFGTAAISCTLITVSYFVRRKLLFIVVSVISFVLCYAEAICIYSTSGSDIDGVLYYLLHVASDVIQTSGTTALAANLTVEITPYKYNTCISCICYIVMFLSRAILVFLNMYLLVELFYPSAFLTLSTTLALVAALLYFYFAPETKDKTLLEIQRSYTPDKKYSNPEQSQSIMLNVI